MGHVLNINLCDHQANLSEQSHGDKKDSKTCDHCDETGVIKICPNFLSNNNEIDFC